MSNLNQKAINHFVTKYAGKVLDASTVQNLINEISTTTLNIENKKNKKINFFTAFDKMALELQERLDFYNFVVRNTIQKFHNHGTVFNSGDLIFPKDAKFVGFSRWDEEKQFSFNITDAIRSGEKTLDSEDFVLFRVPDVNNHNRSGKLIYATPTTKIVKIKVEFLLNDPIVIAQHVRKTINERIEEGYKFNLENAQQSIDEVQNEIAKKQAILDYALKASSRWERQKERQKLSKVNAVALKKRREAEKAKN